MSTEFKTLDEMTPAELQHEREQHWVIVKSDTAWWIYRNHAAFIPCGTESKAKEILAQYGIERFTVDRSQRATSLQDWSEFRRDKMRVLNGRGPSVARRVWRWLGGDAA